MGIEWSDTEQHMGPCEGSMGTTNGSGALPDRYIPSHTTIGVSWEDDKWFAAFLY